MAVSDKRMNEKASFKPFFPKEKKNVNVSSESNRTFLLNAYN